MGNPVRLVFVGSEPFSGRFKRETKGKKNNHESVLDVLLDTPNVASGQKYHKAPEDCGVKGCSRHLKRNIQVGFGGAVDGQILHKLGRMKLCEKLGWRINLLYSTARARAFASVDFGGVEVMSDLCNREAMNSKLIMRIFIYMCTCSMCILIYITHKYIII